MSAASMVATESNSKNLRRGFSLVEIIVSVTLLAVAMMSLAGAASLGLNQMGKARQDLQYSADVQQVVDSLVAKGWNNVSNGSTTIRGRAVTWTVTTMNANSQKVNVVVTRRGQAQTTVLYPDTVSLFLANARVQ
ncbi:MAG: prepilin-type N-terminal cleavage/methylation domain-containing protein [Gemmatimonadaceae bacterium]